jgi:hypothetical protein
LQYVITMVSYFVVMVYTFSLDDILDEWYF